MRGFHSINDFIEELTGTHLEFTSKRDNSPQTHLSLCLLQSRDLCIAHRISIL